MIIKLLFLFVSLFSLHVNAANSFVIQGRLLDSSNNPITTTTSFTVQIRSPGTENCLLYQESQTVDLSTTNGAFALTIGAGTRVAASVDGGNSLSTVFSNSSAISLTSASTPCANSDTSYTPASTDVRKLAISFDDGTGVDTLPVISMGWVPQSLYAQDAAKLAGIAAVQFLKVASGTTPTTLTSGQYTELMSLIGGSSSLYCKTDGSNSQTYTGTATASSIVANSVTTVPVQQITGNGLTSGSLLSLQSNSTNAINGNTGLDVAVSGVNANSGVTRTGVSSVVSASGTGSKNIAAYFSATGGDSNVALATGAGNVGIGTTSPVSRLHVATSPAATANFGTLSIGGGPFDGSTSGYYAGAANGASIAVNELSGYTGDLLNLQIAGVPRFRVYNTGGAVFGGSVALSGGQTINWGSNATIGGGTSYIPFSTSGSERMRILSDGNVGIGTTTPTFPLEVAGIARVQQLNFALGYSTINGENQPIQIQRASGTQNAGLVLMDSSNTGAGRFTAISGGGLSVNNGNGSTEWMRINSSGNVGIGTTNPNSKLSIEGSTAAGSYFRALRLNNTAYNNTGPGGVDLDFVNDIAGSNNVGAKIRMIRTNSYNQADLAFFTNNTASIGDVSTEKMRILSDGKVGIGTATPAQALHVVGTVKASNYVIADTGQFFNYAQFGKVTNSIGFPGGDIIKFSLNNTEKMRLTDNGYLGIGTSTPSNFLEIYNGSTTGSYTTSGWMHSSDRRLKKDISSLSGSLDKILKLNPVSFTFINDKDAVLQYGFIAQEVEQLYPSMVQTDGKGLKSMSYSSLVAPMVEAMQELRSENQKLKAALCRHFPEDEICLN